MKKLFTLVALLAMVLGANAQGGKWEKVYEIDYSTYQGFPFYVMGYVPEFDNGYMTDFGAMYGYLNDEDFEKGGDWTEVGTVGSYHKVQFTSPQWHQYFIADGIPTKIDGKYKVIAKVKATAACNINVNMGWGWGEGQQASASVAIPEGSEFQEVEWQYDVINGSSCNLVAQPGTCTETIEWQSLEVYEWTKEGTRPKVWLEDIENGDASKTWAELGLADVKYNDQDNNFKICAWGKEREVNMNDDGGWDPFPATIEADPDDQSNTVFVVHGKPATTEGDASAWDNQFWIQSKHAWTSGLTVKVKFRYKASKEVTVATQCHKQNPSDYLIWHAIGDVNFKEEWQTFEKDMAIADDMGGTWSVAFQLNQNDKDAIDFYFDDLSWQYLQLDNGYFVAGINATTTTSYDDLDNAIQFEDGLHPDGETYLVATVGEKGNASSYVDQVMVSTVRGDDQAFKGATLKPSEHKILNDPDDWQQYVPATNTKLDLPGLGVWKVYIDTEYTAIAFEMIEGTPYEQPDPVAIVTNETNVVVNGLERDDIKDDDHPDGTGAAWDNQFFLIAKRVLKPGEATVVKFKYKASVPGATSGTQCHNGPGQYIHWAAIGSVTFGEDWQDFENNFTIPAECDGTDSGNGYNKDMKSIAFNLAEIKEACVYEFKDFQWYLLDGSLDEGQTYENLIDAEGTQFFFVKEGAGTNPYQFGTDPSGINNVTTGVKNSSAAIYNLSGQRVSNEYKGIVVKSGKKYVVK